MEVPLFSRVAFKIRHFQNKGKTNYPFLSGDCFKSLCDFEITDSSFADNSFTTNLISAKVIFCHSHLVEKLFNEFGDYVSAQVLFAGNSDHDFHTPLKIPPTLKYLFLQNSFISDGKRILTLPIGIENRKLGINGLPRNFIKQLSNLRENKVLVGPLSPTHPARIGLIEKFAKQSGPWVVLNRWIFPDRLAQMYGKFHYVLAPRGNGVDTHRVWEALYKGARPMLEDNEWSRSLAESGFPVVLLPDLEPDTVSRYIETNHPEFHNPNEISQLWMSFWVDRVKTALSLA